MNAYLLSVPRGNGHFSIDNYFDYCEAELPKYLRGWNLRGLYPGVAHRDGGPTQTSSNANKLLQDYIRWPAKLLTLNADLFHIADQNIAWYRLFLRRGKTLVTVNDLINLLIMRKRLPFGTVSRSLAAKVTACVQQLAKADRIICASTNTANCVMSELGLPASRLDVVYHMVPREFAPLSINERRQLRTEIFGDTDLALLHVGQPSNYKNRVAVIKTFELIKRQAPQAQLALTGSGLSPTELNALESKATAASIKIRIASKRSELRNLYNAADVFLFPSIYEGFGWPPLEAMACGCPVISSTKGSLEEVIGDAALKIQNPHDYEAMARAALRVSRDPGLAGQMTSAGFRNISRFSSEVVTAQLAEVYAALA